MRFLSTRGGASVSAAEAIVQGISANGGLFVPESFPEPGDFLHSPSYSKTAYRIMSLYLDGMTGEDLEEMIRKAYSSFDTEEVVPVVPLTGIESVMELWHGPTLAFKDVALQMLPHLMRRSLLQTGENRIVYILVATSGDTGKAALEGFRDVKGTRVLVFYPYGGVSKAQRLQMVTQEGNNVDVCAVRGNFDDAQTGTKQIFASSEVNEELDRLGYRLSSANSINFGRLLPQIVYYFNSYGKLVESGRIKAGEKINFCVPTGNFGDILAGYYAHRMGLPVHRFLCASNRNNVLTDFFHTGIYDDRRKFYKSMSCSIDILISSNLERLLFELCGRDPEQVSGWMSALKSKGKFEISPEQKAFLDMMFYADWCSEEDTLDTIRHTFRKYGYLMDPHTAVGQTVYDRYAEKTGDCTQTVVLSTANPYKFATDVLSAFETPGDDDFANADRLFAVTDVPVPKGLNELRNKPERHLDVCEISDMPERVVLKVR